MKNIKNLLFLLSSKQIYRAKIIIILLFFGSCLEVIGYAFVVPIVAIIASDDGYIKIINIIPIVSFKDFNRSEIIFYFLISYFIFSIFKTLYLHFLNSYRNKFIYNFQENLSQKLFRNYLNKDYIFFLKNNSSKLISDCTESVNLATYSLESFFVFFTEIFILLFFSTILLIYNPTITLTVMIILLILILSFFYYYSKKLKIWGEKRKIVYENIIKNLQEGFSGIRDIILNNKSLFFLNSFKDLNKKNSYFMYKNSIGIQNPKYFLEFAGAFFLVAIVSYLVFQNFDNSALISTISLFAISFFRLMPSFYRILSSYQTIKFHSSSIKSLQEPLLESANHLNVDIKKNLLNINSNDIFKKYIEFSNVNFSYTNQKIILKNINLRINKNETIAIIGETGSGKSTFLDLLLGLLNPDTGKISVDDNTLSDVRELWHAKIAYVSQNFYFIDDSLLSNIAFGDPDNINVTKITDLLKGFNLAYLASRIENGKDVNIGERGSSLSMGEKQRISIIKALYKDSPILIFDEITSSLDQKNEKLVINEIEKIKKDKTIIFVSHKMSSIEFCDTVYEIKDQTLKKVINN